MGRELDHTPTPNFNASDLFPPPAKPLPSKIDKSAPPRYDWLRHSLLERWVQWTGHTPHQSVMQWVDTKRVADPAQKLPAVCMHLVLRSLDWHSLLRAERVSKLWRTRFFAHCSNTAAASSSATATDAKTKALSGTAPTLPCLWHALMKTGGFVTPPSVPCTAALRDWVGANKAEEERWLRLQRPAPIEKRPEPPEDDLDETEVLCVSLFD
jgi:hypothetical protein